MSSYEKEGLTEDEYKQVNPVLQACSPAALIKSEAADAPTEGAGRYDLIKKRLQLIDPTLRAVFVPKTLYELFYIRESIQEDVKNNAICPIVVDSKFSQVHAELRQDCKTRKCWHFIPCMSPEENEDDGVQYIAYRLNEAMRGSFDPSVEGFTHQELSAFVEKEIQFLKEHHKSSKVASNAYSEAMARDEKQKVVPEALCDCTTPGPTSNFGFESDRGNIMPMGIRNEADAQIIRNAIALECSHVAQEAFLLYRGANFQNDSMCGPDNKPYSLSYGSSLFAGCVHDAGASAFHYMRNKQDAYAVPIRYDQLNSSPFFIPTAHTVAQLFGSGETFHARTRAWEGFDVDKIKGGFHGFINHRVRGQLNSKLSKEESIAQFAEYKNLAYHLK